MSTPSVLLGDLMIVGGGALWAATTLVVKATPLLRAPPEKALGYQVAVSIPILGSAAWISGETLTRVPGPLALSLMAYQAFWVVGLTFLIWFCAGQDLFRQQIVGFYLHHPFVWRGG